MENTQQPEEWAWITTPVDYTGKYMISTHGRCKSFAGVKERLLKCKTANLGYQYYHLSTGLDKPRTISLGIGRLIARHFPQYVKGQESEFTPYINHIDHDPTNNHVSNLEWVNAKYNVGWSQGYLWTVWHETEPDKKYEFSSRRDVGAFIGTSRGSIDYYTRIGKGRSKRGWHVEVIPMTGKERYNEK